MKVEHQSIFLPGFELALAQLFHSLLSAAFCFPEDLTTTRSFWADRFPLALLKTVTKRRKEFFALCF